ncbi:manganese efflux pump [bacterium]|nr:manganese efflux pump [bacterium]
MYQIILLSIALSIDATVVSFTQGLIFKQNRIKLALTLAFWFGLFQALMPLLGAYLTGFIYDYISSFSKWIIFIIFTVLGVKFIKEAVIKGEEQVLKNLSFACIILFAISTSIDALAAGVTLRLMNINLLFPILLIGIVTFINSIIGFSMSGILKNFNEKYIQIFGGIILILLGVKEII